MKGWGPKKTESNSNKNIPFDQQKRPVQINNLAFNNKKTLKQMTPQQQYQQLKEEFAEKQVQFQSKQKMYRIELFKNAKIKEDIQQVDKEFQLNKVKITLDLLEKSIFLSKKDKNNKDSPLFYNQNGISPLELTLIEEKKYRSGMDESFVCMICFQDIENNQIVIDFPCGDNFHKDCAIQHLLGSKYCPSCNEVIDLASHYKKKISKEQKKPLFQLH